MITHHHMERRDKVRAKMEDGDVLLLFATPEGHEMGGAPRFYQDRNFLYLSGFPEPDAALILIPGDSSPYKLFVRPRNPDLERWTGRRFGMEGARDVFGADEAFSFESLEEKLTELLFGKRRLFYRFGVRSEYDAMVLRVLTHLRRNQKPENNPGAVVDSGQILHPLRLIKTQDEIELTRKSVQIAMKAFASAIKETRVGMFEYQVEAMVEEIYRFEGGDGPSFPTIVAAGVNATYLHYVENSKQIEPGELFLLDSGCLYGGYASDLTRTFLPETQAPTPEQNAIYDAVLAIEQTMVDEVRPGISLYELNQICQRKVTSALVDLGILSGDIEEIVTSNRHKTFFPHRLGHWLGSDVHDAGSFGMEDPGLKLAPGMMLTIEPGIYIPEDAEGSAKPFAGIGVRIEDDVLVTAEGRENLSIDLPRDIVFTG
ncbi:MAG TPA: aminopeptidase P N-terminal domain-containing protein [Thermoanaerobaculia bacterium]|nr:aminopeptidase P N-terminal domain-containing protein [Thermoanaerobaculia bacterium]HUM28692.1 aminopeptidase P N-terminal domain-containing protein [Thermoanaerobaculia bacterium]HXK66700.1 aminopeptidase P N-terminal domain-containing protein [Thermoanaerobaculia bacterium]